MKPLFIRSIPNPSPLLVLQASCGYRVDVPVGHEVQLWHFGEDGPMPVLCSFREYLIDAQQGQWNQMQDWYHQELETTFLDLIDLCEEEEEEHAS